MHPLPTAPGFLNPTITIEHAKVSDAPKIASLGVRTFISTFGHSIPAHDLKAYLEESWSTTAFTADISSPLNTCIVARTSTGEILGFAVLTRGTSEPCILGFESPVQLWRLYVDGACHGKGIGKRLACKLEEVARVEGFKSMWLGVWEENYIAQKVYERLGFANVGTRCFTAGTCVQTAVVMIKTL